MNKINKLFAIADSDTNSRPREISAIKRLARCPNGTRRNKKTGLCEKNGSLKNSSQKKGSLKNSSQKKGSQKNSSQKKGSVKNSSVKNGSQKNSSVKNSSEKKGSLKNSSVKKGSVPDIIVKKLKRCPNKTRRNRKTGLCEKY